MLSNTETTRVRDNFEAQLARIQARLLKGDYAGALDECDSASESPPGSAWRIDFFRGYIHATEGRFKKAKIALDRVQRHTTACPDPYCLGQGVYIILFLNAYQADSKDEALRHINDFVRAEPKDIWGLWLRGILLQELWRDRTNNGFLEKAICDLRSAYALIRSLTDNNVYRLKRMRDLSDAKKADLQTSCQSAYGMYTFMEIQGAWVDKEADAVDTNDILDLLNPVMPAWELHIDIGLLLVHLLGEANEDGYLVEAVEILEEIQPLAEQHASVERLNILAAASGANLDVYEIHGDVKYLDAAKSKLKDLLRLCRTEALNIDNEMREYIEKIETEISKFTNASDASQAPEIDQKI